MPIEFIVYEDRSDCFICERFLHAGRLNRQSLVYADVMVVYADGAAKKLVPVHPHCKRIVLDDYEESRADAS